jgi:hypothetical protein
MLSAEELIAVMGDKTDEELLQMFSSTSEWSIPALRIARVELLRRKTPLTKEQMTIFQKFDVDDLDNEKDRFSLDKYRLSESRIYWSRLCKWFGVFFITTPCLIFLSVFIYIAASNNSQGYNGYAMGGLFVLAGPIVLVVMGIGAALLITAAIIRHSSA